MTNVKVAIYNFMCIYLLLKDSKKNYHKESFGILGIERNLEHVGKMFIQWVFILFF